MFPTILRMICHLYPFYSGRAKIANSALFTVALSRAPNTTIVQLINDDSIIVPTNDHIGRTVYYFGDYDRKISWLCQRILRRGDTFVDIGANLGVLTLIAASLVGPEGVVHAFEPQSELVGYLRLSIRENGYCQVFVHPIALGLRDGNAQLCIPHDNAGAASFVRVRPGARTERIVPMRRAGAYLEACDLGPIRLIKIDVEGYEEQVLRGACDFIAKKPPQAVIFELNDDSTPFATSPSVQLLRALGYAFYEIRRSVTSMRVYAIDERGAKARYWQDILAIHRSGEYRDLVARLTR